ncbi:hypothetical protein PR202_ga30078 [Eleusine coracana subsp. coracana]|uniref:RRM domain-containing protein n=1 Tax=Eleusine coracana subsp. coracana TaxID=191504 RepID=A0AAV5DLK9_ELECO|nr:hypothetical protein PR202_ga30078 [Eleusine coracana subsp. coracana]
MAREAEPDAEQQLSRRPRRLFSAEERVIPHGSALASRCRATRCRRGRAPPLPRQLLRRNPREEFLHGEHVGRNVSTRCFPEAGGTDDERMSMSLKRRPVWDRLGEPIVEDRGLVRTHVMTVQNGLHKKAKLMVPEHEQRHCADSYSHHDVFDKANPRKFTNCHTDVNTGQAHEHVGRANKSRLIGRLSFDGGRAFHGDMDRNNVQDREVLSQKSSLSLPVKSSRLQSMNEFTSKMTGLPASVPDPTRDIFTSSKGHAMTSIKSPPLTARRNSETEVLFGDQGCSPALSNTPSSVREDGSSCRNKPVKDEILDMKLKIKQMELDVLKLRSKQMQINIEKQGSLSLGPHANFDEDGDSRTVLVTNVHFAATKEALSTHFMKCGTVLNINIVMDAITGHPKGAAYITFADKDSIEKAVSLTDANIYFFSVGIFCFQVMRKADAPPGLLASVQQPWSPLQPWSPPPFQKGSTPKQASKYHLQWKREHSVLEKSPAS